MTKQTKLPEWIFYPCWVNQHQGSIKRLMVSLDLDPTVTFDFEDFAMQLYFTAPDLVENLN